MQYNIIYVSPAGNIGTHYYVKADDETSAGQRSLELLCSSTRYKPEDFTILKVVPAVINYKETAGVL